MEQLTPLSCTSWVSEIWIDEAKKCELKLNDHILTTVDTEYFVFSFTDILKRIKAKISLIHDANCSIKFTPIEEEIMKINEIDADDTIDDEDNKKWTHLNIANANLQLIGDPNLLGYHFNYKFTGICKYQETCWCNRDRAKH